MDSLHIYIQGIPYGTTILSYSYLIHLSPHWNNIIVGRGLIRADPTWLPEYRNLVFPGALWLELG